MRLLSAFADRSGIPLLLNTSFNLKGMPLVETPKDALQSFLATELDALYLGRFRLLRPPLSALRPRIPRRERLAVDYGLGAVGEPVMSVESLRQRGNRPIPVQLDEDGVRLWLAMDGRRSLAEAIASACPGALAEPSRAKKLEKLAQALMRGGAVRMRVGDLDL
jgi:carbamoyltransferase